MNNNLATNIISYSQLSQWIECPFRWYLSYIKKLRTRSQTIHILFGSSMHEVIQEYLNVMYNKSLQDAQELDLSKMLQDKMKANFINADTNKEVMDVTLTEMKSFYLDGVEILNWLKAHVTEYFPKRGFELIGTELPLEYLLKPGIKLFAYLDIVIRDKIFNKIRIIDLKTSGQGWNKYQKKDKKKLMQLVIYKRFYSAQYNVKPEDITVEFFILKRKLWENSEFPQKRIQRIEPASGSVTTNETINQLNEFVDACFTETGEYKTDIEYEKRPSAKTCKYCEYNGTQYCDRKKTNRCGENH